VKPPTGKWQALAATARIANLPTVVSNVSLGLLVANPQATPATLALLSGAALYFSGGFLNDWADRSWDAKHRPERALPRGLLAPMAYLATALGFATLGIATAAMTGPIACGIAALIAGCIGIYTWLHKKSAWSVLPMGLCRALLPALGMAAAGGREMWPAACAAGLGLLLHVAGISWLARGESRRRDGDPPHVPWLFVACTVLMTAAAWLLLKLPPLSCIAASVPYALWTGMAVLRRGMDVGARVSALLAGIPWVDWIILLPLFLAAQAPALACWLPPLAFAASRLAQRFSPAT
jgi:4-hydroxybenzoate polyprenyltransferase